MKSEHKEIGNYILKLEKDDLWCIRDEETFDEVTFDSYKQAKKAYDKIKTAKQLEHAIWDE